MSPDRPEGSVTVTGGVDSWAEKNAVEQFAASSSGIDGIVNKLIVAPHV